MFRALNSSEVDNVSGGIIIVNGTPPSTPGGGGQNDDNLQGAGMYLAMNYVPADLSFGVSQQEVSENPEGYDPTTADSDGDGVPDAYDSIDVNGAHPSNSQSVGGGIYAQFYNDGTAYLFERVSFTMWQGTLPLTVYGYVPLGMFSYTLSTTPGSPNYGFSAQTTPPGFGLSASSSNGTVTYNWTPIPRN